jgi:hypothetical protein
MKPGPKPQLNPKYKTPLYNTWRSMLSRCYYASHRQYKDWGGRGIRVCDEWHDFDQFVSDMGDKPGPEYSLERIDNNGNYEPLNCKWATRQEQANNKRPNNPLTKQRYEGKTIKWWARTWGTTWDQAFLHLMIINTGEM